MAPAGKQGLPCDRLLHLFLVCLATAGALWVQSATRRLNSSLEAQRADLYRFLTISQDPDAIIAMIIALLLFIGLFMDINATLIILAPVLAPLTVKIGMDPVHAGVMIILALNISLMTPPVGACLFVLASVTKEKIEAITKSLWPFLVAEVAVLLLIAYWDGLTLAIPRLLGLSQL